ncbi:MAG: hypothetical protein LUE93_02155, partial [Bacteroides sp.]|nr:hypothetical protein [Bacteroides sp.]
YNMKHPYKNTLFLFLFLSFFLALFSSCQPKVTPSYIGDSAPVIRLEGVELRNPDLYMGYILASDDSLLYTTSLLKDTLMHLYEVKGDSLILKQKFVTTGSGPFEVDYNGFVFSYDKPTQRVTVLDRPGTLTKGYIIDASSENNLCNTDTWQEIDFSDILNFMFWGGFLQLNDSVLLTLGGTYETQEILSLINLNNLSVTPPKVMAR